MGRDLSKARPHAAIWLQGPQIRLEALADIAPDGLALEPASRINAEQDLTSKVCPAMIHRSFLMLASGAVRRLPFIPLGLVLPPQAFRRSIRDVVKGVPALFCGVKRA